MFRFVISPNNEEMDLLETLKQELLEKGCKFEKAPLERNQRREVEYADEIPEGVIYWTVQTQSDVVRVANLLADFDIEFVRG